MCGFLFESFNDCEELRHVFGARNDSDLGNLAYSGERDRKAAFAARSVWSQYLNTNAESWVVGGQTHSANVAVVTEKDRGRGALAPTEVIPDTDGLFTTCRNLPMYVAVADCSAVLLHAPGALAVVHGGWRGLAKGILGQTLKHFQNQGCALEQLRIGIAPCMQAASYEVGPEVAESCPDAAKYRGRDDRWQVDIAKWAAADLHAAGIQQNQIETSGLDTGTDTRLFSHRRQGEGAGRNGLIALLV
ncbi:MAG: polyphenol oxidase family protein [Planctomycetes bacterium]|nr:polyphenol oxidase family protein [Planctomycetota bacterium]MCP4860184.1 polyphenol oxidase family protein [Planctomycetota bacterium]